MDSVISRQDKPGQDSFLPRDVLERHPVKPKRITDFYSFLIDHRNRYMARDRLSSKRRHRKWAENWLFIDGRQYGVFYTGSRSVHEMRTRSRMPSSA